MTNAFAEIPMKMDITGTVPTVGRIHDSQYSWLFEFPNVAVGDAQMPISGPGAIPQNVEMAALSAAVAPTGMVGLTQHFRATNVN